MVKHSAVNQNNIIISRSIDPLVIFMQDNKNSNRFFII